MVWYYADGDRQRGPISDQEFEDLVRNGRVQGETLVWQDGMDTWRPLKEVNPEGLATASPSPYIAPQSSPGIGESSALPAAAPVPTGADLRPGTSASAACSQCGRSPLGPGDGVRLGNIVLCTGCDEEMARYYGQQSATDASGLQPAAVAPQAGPLVFASIFSRAIAKFLDGIIQNIAVAIVLAATVDFQAMGLNMQDLMNDPEKFVTALRPYFLGGLIFTVLYDAILIGAFGATLGKMALGIRVVSGKGARATWNQAMVRAIVPGILQLPMLMIPMSIWASIAQFVFLFGYVIAVMDPERRTLYDHAAGTRVVQ